MAIRIKVLSLVLLAALAISAVEATAAQGEFDAELTAEEFPALVTGEQEGIVAYTRAGRSFSCEVVQAQEEVAQASTTFSEGTATLEGCSTSIGPVTARTSGCAFLFHLTGDAEHIWTATADFICPGGTKAEVLVYSSHQNHTSESPTCVYEYPSQTDVGTAELTNKAPGGETSKDWITAHIDVSGITSTRTSGSALICGPEHDSAGTLVGDAILKGTNLAGEDNGITISTDL